MSKSVCGLNDQCGVVDLVWIDVYLWDSDLPGKELPILLTDEEVYQSGASLSAGIGEL